MAALVDGVASPLEINYEGHLADLDTRLLTSAVLTGALEGHVEDPVNVVNAGSLAAERGITWTETSTPQSRDYTNRLTVAAGGVDVGGTTVGTTSRPRLVQVFGQEIDIELSPHLGIFRYTDVPAQIGLVGKLLGESKVNIASAAVSRSEDAGAAVMVVAVDSPVSDETVARIAALEGFEDARFVSLA
ncbi:MAG: hypothetical protein RLN63_09225 [Miltoncostaeaceae bacterium]